MKRLDNPAKRAAHRDARNEFANYVYDRLQFFMKNTNKSNMGHAVKQFVDDVTDTALGPKTLSEEVPDVR